MLNITNEATSNIALLSITSKNKHTLFMDRQSIFKKAIIVFRI